MKEEKELQRLLEFAATHYCLIELEAAGYSSFQFKQYSKWFEPTFALMLRDYLFHICVGEARWTGMKTRAITFPELEKDCTYNANRWRDSCYKHVSKYDPNANAKILYHAFADHYWKDSNYGGDTWATLVKLYARYGTISDRIFIDQVIHAEHNSGTVFNKEIIFADETKSTTGYEEVILKNFLNCRQEKSPIASIIECGVCIDMPVFSCIKDAVSKGFIKGIDIGCITGTVLKLNHHIEYGDAVLVAKKISDPCEGCSFSGCDNCDCCDLGEGKEDDPCDHCDMDSCKGCEHNDEESDEKPEEKPKPKVKGEYIDDDLKTIIGYINSTKNLHGSSVSQRNAACI